MRDPLECQSMTIKTRASLSEDGIELALAEYGFLLEIARFDGASFSVATRSAERCAELLTDLLPARVTVETAFTEDRAALLVALKITDEASANVLH